MIERLLAADAALARGELEHAGRLFAQVVDADARNAIAVVGLARVALRGGAPDEARSLARRALDIDPDEAAARRLLDELDTRAATEPGPAVVVEPTPDPGPAVVAEPTPEPGPAAVPAPSRSRWRRWLDRILGRG
jgi:thioredoxin-like negative regulator of GroEL